jgi:hypothetical protein
MTSKVCDVNQTKTHPPNSSYNYYFPLKRNQPKILVQPFLVFTLVLLYHSVSSMSDGAMANALSQNTINKINVSRSSVTNTSSTDTPISRITKCPDLVDVDPGSTAFNSSSIECVQNLFNSCTSSRFLLLYGLGSLNASIKGKSEEKDNGTRCLIELNQETEMGERNPYSCSIPIDKIVGWRSWRNASGLEALDDVSSFCHKIMSNS